MVLLDLSAAFDTVAHKIHEILHDRMQQWIRLSGTILRCFRSFLEDRGFVVAIRDHHNMWSPPGIHSRTAIIQPVHVPSRSNHT